jgi:hypothetical protein
MRRRFVSKRLFLVPKRTMDHVTPIRTPTARLLAEWPSPPRKRRSTRMDREDGPPPAA